MRKLLYCFAIILLFFIFKISSISAAPIFDPNNIISDEEMLDYGTMSLNDIQKFLESKNSFLANYSCPNAAGEIKKASEIIYEAATDNYDCTSADLSPNPTKEEKRLKCDPVKINPKFLIVLLQKEQSLIEDNSPTPRQLDWALGYGCPDSAECNNRFKGFGKQINSAALQYFDYIAYPKRYRYQVGQTYTVTNTGKPSSVITPANRATAGLYNYTPHVYNGNFNFFKLWNKYFTINYFDGSLIRAKGEAGIWLIQNGKRRPFLSKGALTSRFDLNKVIDVSPMELNRYEKGDPIKFAQYSLVRSPRGTIYLLIDDKRRGFNSSEAFRKIGLNPEEIIDASWGDLEAYAEIEPITSTTTYPTGALLQNKKTGGVFWVENNTKAPIIDRVLLKTRFKNKPIHPISPEKLDSFTTIAPALFNDGEILKSPTSQGVYLIVYGQKKAFISGELFEKLGYKWNNVISIPQKLLDLYPTGEPIKEIQLAEDEIIEIKNDQNICSSTATSTMIGSTTIICDLNTTPETASTTTSSSTATTTSIN